MTEYLYAFLIGALLCTVAQLLIDLTNMTPAKILVLYVCAGVFLGAVGLYEPLMKFAQCGASVPLTGFGYVLAEGVKETVAQKGFIGIFGGIAAAAPGIGSALCFSLLFALIFNAKPRNPS